MLRSSCAPRIAALSLAAALMVPWSAAAAPARQAPPGRRTVVPESLLQQLRSLWDFVWSSGWAADSLDAGCHVDPNGRCIADPNAPAGTETLDAGCHLDPDGRCVS